MVKTKAEDEKVHIRWKQTYHLLIDDTTKPLKLSIQKKP
jgi:hypothetical protein